MEVGNFGCDVINVEVFFKVSIDFLYRPIKKGHSQTTSRLRQDLIKWTLSCKYLGEKKELKNPKPPQ